MSSQAARAFASPQAGFADRYTIKRELGRGGMAIVFLAEDLKHRRKVAIKVLRPELTVALGRERFLREIATVAPLNHPNILPLHDSGEVGGLLYYVMPLVEGESLRDRLSREGRLPLSEALTIAREVADALAYAHHAGVIHRDIKPENILFQAGHALVADFGISRAVPVAGGEMLTDPGLAVGTPTYMSPEQAAGVPTQDARSDIYSLGAVLYEMLAGEPPCSGPTSQSIISKLLAERPVRLRTVRVAIPDGVERTVMKALEKVPADRFVSAAEFAEALSSPPAKSALEKSKGSRGFSVLRAAVVAVGILFGVAFLCALVFSPDGKSITFNEGSPPPLGGELSQLMVSAGIAIQGADFGADDSSFVLGLVTRGSGRWVYVGHAPNRIRGEKWKCGAAP